jgi:putative hemolysin
MTELILLLGALAALILSGISSGAETGVYSLNRVRLRVRAEQGDPDGRRLTRLMNNQEGLVVTALLGTNVFDYFFTACVTALLLHWAASAGHAELYATLICTPLVLVFGGIIPKDWFRRESDRLMYRIAAPLQAALGLVRLTGLAWVTRRVTRSIVRWVDPEHADQGEAMLPRARVLSLLQEGAARGGLSTFQRAVIERVLNVSNVRISAVMIPPQRMATVPIDLARTEFLRIARMAHFSRLPVWQGNPRNVVGVVNVYDVLTDEEARPIAVHVRPPLFLGPRDTVPAALLRLQQSRQAMGIIRDRQGNCIGILTMKDLVEEIVGDLEVW